MPNSITKALKEIAKQYRAKRNMNKVLVCGAGNSIRTEKDCLIKFIYEHNPLKIAINGYVYGLLEICTPEERKVLIPDVLVCSIEKIHRELYDVFFLTKGVVRAIEKNNILVIADVYYEDISKHFTNALRGKYKDDLSQHFTEKHSMAVGGSVPLGLGLLLKPKLFAYIGIADPNHRFKYFWRHDPIKWEKWTAGKRKKYYVEKYKKWYLENDPRRAALQESTTIPVIREMVDSVICLNKEA